MDEKAFDNFVDKRLEYLPDHVVNMTLRTTGDTANEEP